MSEYNLQDKKLAVEEQKLSEVTDDQRTAGMNFSQPNLSNYNYIAHTERSRPSGGHISEKSEPQPNSARKAPSNKTSQTKLANTQSRGIDAVDNIRVEEHQISKGFDDEANYTH